MRQPGAAAGTEDNAAESRAWAGSAREQHTGVAAAWGTHTDQPACTPGSVWGAPAPTNPGAGRVRSCGSHSLEQGAQVEMARAWVQAQALRQIPVSGDEHLAVLCSP